MKLERSAAAATPAETVGERWNRVAKERSPVAAWRMIAIGIVALVALVAIVLKFASSSDAQNPPDEPPRALSPVPVEGLSPAGRIPRSEIGNSVPIRFRWQRLESASYYFIRVFSPDGTPLDSNQVTAPPYEVSASKRDLFLASGAYSWEVSAYTADARRLGTSDRVTFTID